MRPETEAVLRERARERLNRIDELRVVAFLRARGLSQGAIIERLGTTQPRIMRLSKVLEYCSTAEGGEMEVTPEEIILRTVVEQGDRRSMVDRLKGFSYSFGESAPYPDDGYIAGTWDQVRRAHSSGYLASNEFEEICAAVGR